MAGFLRKYTKCVITEKIKLKEHHRVLRAFIREEELVLDCSATGSHDKQCLCEYNTAVILWWKGVRDNNNVRLPRSLVLKIFRS